MAKGPGRSHRKGISLIELAERFPTEEAAVKWFEDVVWPAERTCGKCGGTRTVESSHAKMPYWCSDCRSYFSVRTGTVMERSKVPVRKWVYAIYLDVTSLKGVAAMKLHRDIGVTYNFVDAHADPGAKVYTDGSTAYKGRENHESVAHSAGEYVRYLQDEKIHTNGVESFWSMLKRAHTGTFHRLSPKHLHRYVNEFCGRHNILPGSRGRQRAVGSGKLSRSSPGAPPTRFTYEGAVAVGTALTLTRQRCRFRDPTHRRNGIGSP